MSEKEQEKNKQKDKGFSLHSSGWSKELLDEWIENCKLYYRDNRALKIWSDHLRAKESKNYNELLERVAELEERVTKLEGFNESEKPVSELKTMGERGVGDAK